ncbi:ras association domain-containing protein 10 [Rhipicephalus microplus]|uniref:ras association domain-containing protein 10 n=1 Tax=Rhipicephalus microplus TaxID=6941 RepID=UPI003F6D6264
MGAEIPVWVGGVQKWVTGVGRKTTCEEVVRALLASSRSSRKSASQGVYHGADPLQYALVEVCPRGIERRLEGDSRILKLWNSEDDVRLSLRRVRCWSSTTSSPTSDSCVAEPPRHHHRRRHHHHHSHHRRGQASGGSSSTTTTSSSASPRLLRTVHPRKLSASVGALSTSQNQHGGQQEHAVLQNEELAELVKRVICQGETLERQAALLARRDAEIEHHEAKKHAMRVRQMGPDYMLDGYRPEASEEESLQTYQATLEAYDRVLQLCRRITAEEEKVQRLSAELRQYTWQQEEERRRSQEQLNAAREEQERMEELSRSQEEALERNERALRDLDHVLEDKKRMAVQLEEQLRLVELEEGDMLVRRCRPVELPAPPRPAVMTPLNPPAPVVASAASLVTSSARCCIDAQDSSSDTGVSSMYSFEEVNHVLDTLV